ncbi:MAG: YfhO family protein [Bacteroidota bacterium]
MKNINLKVLIPVIAAIAIFIVLTLGYFSPVLKGKVIIQSDMVSSQGMSKETNDFRDQYKKEALWTNSMFGGMPTYQISMRYPNNLMQYVRQAFNVGLPGPANIVFVYLIGFFILLRVLKVDPWLSIMGSIAFAFSAYNIIIIDAGHITKAFAIGYIPMVFAGVILVNRGKYLLGGALTALFFGVQLYCNHVQITYYMFMFLGIYIAMEWIERIRQKEYKEIFKSIVVFAIAGILALGCNINNLWNTADYAAVTIRGASELTSDQGNKTSGLDKDYATQWSMGKSETMTLMIPGFKGLSSSISVNEDKSALKKVDSEMRESIGGTSQYWGDQPFTMSPYSGAIIVFLFILGLFIVEGRMKWALLLGTIFSILLSWGHNFMALTEFFLDHFPMYNKFRAVSMILVIAEFTIPLLAVLALDKLLRTPDLFTKKIKLAFVKTEISVKNAFFISFGLTGGLSLIYYMVPSLTDFFGEGEYNKIYDQIAKSNGAEIAQKFMDNLEIARISLFKSGAIRSFFFTLLAATTIWLFLKSKITKTVLIVIMSLLVFIDLVQIDRDFVNNENFKTKQESKVPFPLTPADKEILEDTDPNYRVLNIAVNTFNEAGTSYYHKSIGGYHAAKLRRYQDLIDVHIQNNIQNIMATLRANPTDSLLRATFAKQGALNMLNTRYIIFNKDASPLRNRYALGNAWFVKDVKTVRNADEEIKAVGEINPGYTAVVDERFKNQLEGFTLNNDASGTIKLIDYKPNHLKYESNSTAEQVAVFSEIYYSKGWNAYIDGELKPHFCTDYVLRGMRVPAGKHMIEFKFEPSVYFTGEKISLISSILLFIAVGIAIFMAFKKKEL